MEKYIKILSIIAKVFEFIMKLIEEGYGKNDAIACASVVYGIPVKVIMKFIS